jgi:hypothetical protein
MGNDTTLSDFIAGARQTDVPTTGDEAVDDILNHLSGNPQDKSKIQKILSVIEGDDNLSKEDIGSDQFIKQFYAVHRIVSSLSNELDKQSYYKYIQLSRELFDRLEKSGVNNGNTLEEYKYLMGQHKERFGSNDDIEIGEQISYDADDDLMTCITEAFAKGGLTAAELYHRIDVRSLETLQQPNPYIIIVDPQTGPRRRPYLGDSSLLRRYLTRVESKEIDGAETDDARAAIVVDDTQLTKDQIRYQVVKYLDNHDIDEQPNDLTKSWQNRYIDTAEHARQSLFDTINLHGIEKLEGNRSEWMTYFYNLIDDKMRMSQANSDHAKKTNVPDQLANKLDDEVTSSLERANLRNYDEYVQSNYVRHFHDIVGLIHYNLKRVTHPAKKILTETYLRNNTLTIVWGVSAMITIYSIILISSVTLLGVPIPNDLTSISSYQPIHQLQALITIGYFGVQFAPKSLVYSDKKWANVFSLGMMSDAFALSMLRGDFTSRVQKSMKSLKNKYK